jgi:putative peptidoglycan lipid II flippase
MQSEIRPEAGPLEPRLQGGRLPEARPQEAQRGALSTALLMGSTSISRVLGYVRIALIGALFGASGPADVWNAVFWFPNTLRKLLAEGALSSAFIPALSASLLEDPSGEIPRQLTRRILGLQMAILIPLTVAAALFAGPLTRLLMPFPDPAKAALAARLFRWVFGYLLFICLSAVLIAVLNSHGLFLLPSLAPILFSVCVIAATILFYRSLGVFSMAIGVLLGGLTQVVYQLPAYLRKGYDLKLDFRFGYPPFARIIKAWPVLAIALISWFTDQVAGILASGLEDGSFSALSNALVFFQLPFGIFSVSIVTVLFPKMSRQAAAGDLPGLRFSVSYGLRFILVLLVPASLLFVFLGREIVAVALQRGAFGLRGTQWTAGVLRCYAYGLFSVGAFTFLQRFFYSRHAFRTPLYSALLVAVVDIALSLWLRRTPLRVRGLAVANSVAFTAGFLHLLIVGGRQLGGLDWKGLLRTCLRMAVSLVPFTAFLVIFRLSTHAAWAAGSTARNLGLLTAGVVASVAILGAMYWLMRVEMLRDIVRRRVRARGEP